jgi:hypothetical protein
MHRFLRNLFARPKKDGKPRSSTRRDRRVRLDVDVLEDRMTPSISVSGTTVTVRLDSFDEGAGRDTVTLSEISPQNPGIVVKVQDSLGNYEQQQFGAGTIDTVLLGGSQYGNDTYNINGIPSGVTAYVDEANGPSVVNVTQPTGNFGFVQGRLSIWGGTPTLNIYDQYDGSVNLTYTVTNSYMTETNAGVIQFGNSSAVNLYGSRTSSSGPSTYNVMNTPGWGTSSTTSTTLTTGFGADTVNVLATTGQLTVHGQGLMTANLGNHGSVQNINGFVTLDNPPSWTTINVDDSADPTGRTAYVWGTSYGVISGLAPAWISFIYSDTSSVTVRTGTGGNTVDVWDTGVTTNIVGNAFAYLDHVNVGYQGNVQGIRGTLNISNPPGWTVINVDDSRDPNPQIASLAQSSFSPDWGTLSGLAPARINYNYFDTYGLFIETNNFSLVTVYTDGGVDTWLNGRFV